MVQSYHLRASRLTVLAVLDGGLPTMVARCTASTVDKWEGRESWCSESCKSLAKSMREDMIVPFFAISLWTS